MSFLKTNTLLLKQTEINIKEFKINRQTSKHKIAVLTYNEYILPKTDWVYQREN